MTTTPSVSMHGIRKRFDGFEALKGVDFELRTGEIHGLLGENGAGKTTLMNILYGLLTPDAGTIEVNGRQVSLRNPQDAIANGIGMVHQHFMLVPTLTVAENMVLGEQGGVLVRKRRLREAASRIREYGERYGLEADPDARVWQLSVGEQQRVEILRALYHDAKVLLLDEPTASLTPPETEQLLPRLRALAGQGASVVFITHHLEEVLAWTDRITVLRHGELVETVRPRNTSAKALARGMVGREVTLRELGVEVTPASEPAQTTAVGPAVLTVTGLEARGDMGTTVLHGLEFSAAAGEIVAIAGVEGNGQAELEGVLCGLRPATAGTVSFGGGEITNSSTARRLKAGIGIIPSDRYRRGVIRALSVAENLVCDRIGQEPLGNTFSIRRRAIAARADELVQRFSIRISRLEQPAGTLSGGNAQRLVLARTLSRDLRCLIAASPTRGLDVGAMEFVWQCLEEARKAGVAILLVSTDLDEVMALADRCYVLYSGRLVAHWARRDLEREKIGLAIGGVVEPPVSSAAVDHTPTRLTSANAAEGR